MCDKNIITDYIGYAGGGILSICLLPQIYKTYKEKKVGNLSILSLLFQAPGSLIVFIYQYCIVHAPISIGIPYFF